MYRQIPFGRDQHPDLKADYVMANPPFNQKDWRAADELTDDPRWNGYEVPPTSNANYAWILNMVSKLSENGVAGFVLANGALSGGGEEYKIRRKLIENQLGDAIMVLPQNMFYTTNISVTIWILNKNKKKHSVELPDTTRNYRDREDEILFLDLREIGEPFEKKFIQFSPDTSQKLQRLTTIGNKSIQDIKIFRNSVTLQILKRSGKRIIPWYRVNTLNL